MPWLQLTMRTDAERSERLSASLQTAGALAVTLADAEDTPVLEPEPGETPIWPSTLVTALYPAGTDLTPLHKALLPHLTPAEASSWHTEELADQIWERTWMDHFRPTRFGKRLWVCPKGQPSPQKDAVVVELDPGLAFGTGTHPTTALCLQWLDGAAVTNRAVIDYGCGSGILTVAAAKLGAISVRATDIDPQALLATGQNATHNRVADRVLVTPPELLNSDPADIVVANILSGPLIELVPTLTALVAKSGHLVLAGLLAEQSEAVKLAYQPAIEWHAATTSEEWICLQGTKVF